MQHRKTPPVIKQAAAFRCNVPSAVCFKVQKSLSAIETSLCSNIDITSVLRYQAVMLYIIAQRHEMRVLCLNFLLNTGSLRLKTLSAS